MQRRMSSIWVVSLALLLQAGCQQRNEAASYAGGAAPAPATPAQAKRSALQAMLAYEHDVEIGLEQAQILPRMRAAQAACDGGKFGDCVVLNVQQQGGDRPSASLTVRMAPAGVEPMIALASAGAEIGSRSTRAEDLAVAVRDNALAQSRLGKERERLQQFQQRPDLAVADMIALSRQLAETDAQLEAAAQEGAQHRRRIDTQLLTLRFQPPGGESGRGEIGQALRDFGATLAMGTAWTIRALAFLVPFGLLLAVLVAIVRRWRRGRSRTRA